MFGTAFVAGMLALSAPAEADALEALLREPIGVGNVARLMLHAVDPRAGERWSLALRDPRPGVRAAAARVVAVVGAHATKPAVQAALAAEQDERARRELTRALGMLERTEPDTIPLGPSPSMHTVDGLWPELVDAVLDDHKCKPGDASVGAALIEYGRGGRAVKVEMAGTALTPACAQAARVLLALGLSPAAPEASPRALVVLPLEREWIACTDERTPSGLPRARTGPGAAPADADTDVLLRVRDDDGALPERRGVRVGGQIREPRKLRNVPPHYPVAAKSAGRQGIVIVEATVMPSGCVGTMRVLRSVDLALDFAAFRAVSQWRYTPTTLNGQPVPVIMTVTINFRLNRPN